MRISRLSYANVVATLALFIALGGASYAAVELPARSVGTAQLRPGSVTPGKLAFPLGATGRTELAKDRLGKLDGCNAPEPSGVDVATPCPLERAATPGRKREEQTLTLSGPGKLFISGVADLQNEGPSGTSAGVVAEIIVDEMVVSDPTIEMAGQTSTEMPLDTVVKVGAGVHRFAVVFRPRYSTDLPGDLLVYPVTLWAITLPGT